MTTGDGNPSFVPKTPSVGKTTPWDAKYAAHRKTEKGRLKRLINYCPPASGSLHMRGGIRYSPEYDAQFAVCTGIRRAYLIAFTRYTDVTLVNVPKHGTKSSQSHIVQSFLWWHPGATNGHSELRLNLEPYYSMCIVADQISN